MLLCGLIGLAVQAWYFGFYRPAQIASFLQKSSFIALVFLLITLLLYTLLGKSTAKERLATRCTYGDSIPSGFFLFNTSFRPLVVLPEVLGRHYVSNASVSVSGDGDTGYQVVAGVNYPLKERWKLQSELRHGRVSGTKLNGESGTVVILSNLDYETTTLQLGVV